MIEKMLDELAELHSQRDLAQMEQKRLKQEQIDAVLTDEIKTRLAEIDAEFAGKSDIASDKIASLEAEIKKLVTEKGASVKGEFLHAVFAKGRVTWDTKALDGYVKAHPELTEFRKEGEPSVSLRKV